MSRYQKRCPKTKFSSRPWRSEEFYTCGPNVKRIEVETLYCMIKLSSISQNLTTHHTILYQ